MKRVEIITNHSIKEDLLELIDLIDPNLEYTLFPAIQGRGKQGTRQGSALWPEQNCLLLLFVDDEIEIKIRDVIMKLKKRFPHEGTKIYISQAEEG